MKTKLSYGVKFFIVFTALAAAIFLWEYILVFWIGGALCR